MILIIDTSSEDCLLGLTWEGTLAASTIDRHGNNLSATLLPSIKRLMEKAGASFNELTSIAVGIGPGSYTGTRVGVAVARTLSFGLQIPLNTFCSLLSQLPDITGSFACFMVSRTQDIFVLKGESSKESLQLGLSALLDRGSAIDTLKTAETVVGLPQDDIPFECSLHAPGFKSILKWLNHCSQMTSEHSQPQSDLIYLHTP